MKIPKPLSVEAFLNQSKGKVALDVRSPSEYEKGHIKDAISFPLFSDEERAVVGTLYKQNGKHAAMLKGLEFAGAKMAEMVKNAFILAPDKTIYVHCWRGGMRSGSVAQLLAYVGLDTFILIDGYKAYRQHVLHHFDFHPYKLNVLGGKTGSGKTDVLKALAEKGEQVLDLEGLANHRGSAFGAIMLPPQPSSEQFENLLFAQLSEMNPERPIWVESESRTIGHVFIPQGFWDKMQTSPLFLLEVPEQTRIERLIEEYSPAEASALIEALKKIQTKLGGLVYQQALNAFQNGDLATATELVLKYYDKTYAHSNAQKDPISQKMLTFTTESPAEIADALMQQ